MNVLRPFISVHCAVLPFAITLLVFTGCERHDTSPRQPIAFSHTRHAGEYSINCQYCHSGVRRGPSASIPSVQTCMGCHQLVAATKPEVIKIRQAWENKEPIRWMKVNRVADFVFFNHAPHIAKGIDCRTCHGDVATMTEVRPFVKLNNMTFCVDCHRENKASIDCYTCHR
ncbi:MAG: cytochrome c3 family protein [Ignavibacteriales bacterium]|nr:cytochrome c3 family protein [Ignavibacteriales bacterium]